MSKLPIITFGDPILRKKAKPVTVFHKKFQAVVDSIAETLESRKDGAALAAPQVSILKRVTVIDYENEYLELINPEIISAVGEQTDYEGCLSFSGYIGMVPRFDQITVMFLNRQGQEKTLKREGKMSRCIQHEIDHLDGILYIDRMKEKFLIHQETDTKIDLQSVLNLSHGKIKHEEMEPYL